MQSCGRLFYILCCRFPAYFCSRIGACLNHCIVRRLRNPFSWLAILWFLCTVRCFFDLDMLRMKPSNVGGVHQPGRSSGKWQKNNSTDTGNLNNTNASNITNNNYLTLQDFSYANNLVDLTEGVADFFIPILL